MPSDVETRVSAVTQGLVALILPSEGHVCHSLIVVSNWRPGSAHCHAATEIFSQMSAAATVLLGRPPPWPNLLRRSIRSQVCPASRRAKNSFVMRTELFEFWPETVPYAFESQFVSYVSTISSL